MMEWESVDGVECLWIRGTWLGGREAVGQGFSEAVSSMLRPEEGGADHMGASQGGVELCVKERPGLLGRLARAMQLPCSVWRVSRARWRQSKRQVWCEGPGDEGSLGVIWNVLGSQWSCLNKGVMWLDFSFTLATLWRQVRKGQNWRQEASSRWEVMPAGCHIWGSNSCDS